MEDRRLALGQAAVCVQKAGFEVTVHYGAGLRIGGLELKVPDADGAPDAETSREADEIVRQCLRTHYEPVGERWNAQQTEPSTADVDALSRRLEQCVANGGVPGIESNFGVQYVEYANPASTPVFIEPEDLPQYTECAIQEERETGLKAPYPWPGYSIEDALKYDSRPRGASD